MITRVDRKYLEIDSPDKINLSEKPQNSCKIEKKNQIDFKMPIIADGEAGFGGCLLYTSPSPRD